jgi:hypothetical protein
VYLLQLHKFKLHEQEIKFLYNSTLTENNTVPRALQKAEQVAIPHVQYNKVPRHEN